MGAAGATAVGLSCQDARLKCFAVDVGQEKKKIFEFMNQFVVHAKNYQGADGTFAVGGA